MDDGLLDPGTTDWLTMVGTVLCEAATQAGPAGISDVSLVERYTDGAALGGGLIQGLRFAIRAGRPSFRIGVRPDEHGDVTILVTSAAARDLNLLRTDDPRYAARLSAAIAAGELTVEGDTGRLGVWFATVHDMIVDRTRAPASSTLVRLDLASARSMPWCGARA